MSTSQNNGRTELGQVEVASGYGRPLTLQVEAFSPGYVDGGGTAVVLCDEDGPFTTLSVNATGTSEALPKDEFCVKLWSENEPLREPLLASGLFEDTGRRIPLGYAFAEVWRITAAL